MPEKHSPGPWQVEKQPAWSPHRIFVKSKHGFTIAFFQERKKGSHRGEEARWLGFAPNDEANAWLIAAAPEMLEALEAIVDSARDGRDIPEWLDERLVIIEAAIRKARGAQ